LDKFAVNIGDSIELDKSVSSRNKLEERKSESRMEYMLRMYVMDNHTHWEKYLPLVELSYKNNFHNSIRMPPYQAMYGRPCRTPLSSERLDDQVTVGKKLIQEMEK
jgi:hypothetical protein